MQPDYSPASCSALPRRAAAVWISLFAAAGSCVVAPLVVPANAVQSCPAGQIAATRIDYEGRYNLDPTVDMFNLHALVPNVGYTRRTVLVADGRYKEASEGTIVVVKDTAPGKPVPMPGVTMYAREFPSRFVIIETAQQRLVYDERGDPDQLGRRTNKSKKTSAEDERAIVGGLQSALGAGALDQTKVIGKATHAGVPCEVRQFLMPGSSVCIATIRGQYVTLAEEMQVPGRTEPSRMQAKAKADVCVSTREFEPPAHVRFK